MTDRSAYEVVPSRNGLSGLGIVEFEPSDRSRSSPSAASVFYFTVQLIPKEPHSRVMVVLDDVFFRRAVTILLWVLWLIKRRPSSNSASTLSVNTSTPWERLRSPRREPRRRRLMQTMSRRRSMSRAPPQPQMPPFSLTRRKDFLGLAVWASTGPAFPWPITFVWQYPKGILSASRWPETASIGQN